MALTPEQEAKVLQIITAFDNGKRLNELPHIGEVNPLELIVEVINAPTASNGTRPYRRRRVPVSAVSLSIKASPFKTGCGVAC